MTSMLTVEEIEQRNRRTDKQRNNEVGACLRQKISCSLKALPSTFICSSVQYSLFKATCLLFFISILSTGHVAAQCCSPGNPIGGAAALGVNDPDVMRMFLNYRYGYAGRYFEGSEPSTTQFIRDGDFNHLGIVAAYGLAARLTVEAELGYFINKSQRYVAGIIPGEQKGSGLTDLNLMVRANLLRSTLNEWEITMGAGTKIPLRTTPQQFQGAEIPRDLQPSTGANDFLHTLFLYKGFLAQKIRTFLLTRTEIKGQSRDRYRYGNLLAVSLFGSYSPGTSWVFIGQIRGEFRGRDSRPATGNGIPLDNGREQVIPTGSQKVFLVPQVSYSLTPQLDLSALVEIPAYQYYNDKQLSSTVALMLSVGFTFGGNGLEIE